MAITSAIAYTSWHAFARSGTKHLPEPINEVSEEVIDQVVEYARRAGCFDPQRVHRLVQYFMENHATEDPSILGGPIAYDVNSGARQRGMS